LEISLLTWIVVSPDMRSLLWRRPGVPGAVYSVITSPSLQLNAQFIFIGADSGRTRGQLQTPLPLAEYTLSIKHHWVHLARQAPTKLVTTFWSHSGNYMRSCGVKLRLSGHSQSLCRLITNAPIGHEDVGCELKLELQSGSWESGFSAVVVNGVPLSAGSFVFLDSPAAAAAATHAIADATTSATPIASACAPGVARVSSHAVHVISPHFRLRIVNRGPLRESGVGRAGDGALQRDARSRCAWTARTHCNRADGSGCAFTRKHRHSG
jgi:hypothetical protein